MTDSVALHVQIVRVNLRAEAMSPLWRGLANEDAAQLIGLIGIDAYAAWVQNGSGITDQSTWRDVSDAITDKIFQVLQDRFLAGLDNEPKETQP